MSFSPHPSSPEPLLDQACRAALESVIFDLLMNMQQVFLSPSRCPIPLFSTAACLYFCFSRCAVGERGQPHPSAEWHSMRRRKGEGKSCLVLPLMSKSMHLSLKRWEWVKKRDAIGTPRTRPKHSSQKQLPHAMNRSLFNLAQQYIGPEPLIGQSCN